MYVQCPDVFTRGILTTDDRTRTVEGRRHRARVPCTDRPPSFVVVRVCVRSASVSRAGLFCIPPIPALCMRVLGIAINIKQ